jgi:hypothetical protein
MNCVEQTRIVFTTPLTREGPLPAVAADWIQIQGGHSLLLPDRSKFARGGSREQSDTPAGALDTSML